jgi:hypothetical protein
MRDGELLGASPYCKDAIARRQTLASYVAETGVDGSGTKRALLTGEGGHVRISQDGGQSWTDSLAGEPHRVGDVAFVSESSGKLVGQFFRIARTGNGGTDWLEDTPPPIGGAGYLNAVTFAADGNHAVAVGAPHQPSMGQPNLARILRVFSPEQTTWAEPAAVAGNTAFMEGKSLNEVDWSGGEDWWAAGDGGLILTSRDHGQNWTLFTPPGDPTIGQFQLRGVSFRDQDLGLFAGVRPDGTGRDVGAVYQYRKDGSGQITWIPIGFPAGLTIRTITDVDVLGNDAYAVGRHDDPTLGEVGIVLHSVFSGAQYGTFVSINGSQVFPSCTAGEDLESIDVLNEVEVAPATGDLWVAGECGRVWELLASSGQWVEHKSGTDAHVVGMSIVPRIPPNPGYFVYLAGQRASQTQQCLVRIHQP